jgi:putative flippase GtrA
MINQLVSRTQKILKSRLKRRYIVSGLIVYALEMLIIIVLQALDYSSVIAVSVSFWLGLLATFVIHKIVTFKDKRVHHKILARQIVAFLGLVIFNYLFTVVMVYLFKHLLPTIVIRTLTLAITIIWNLYIYKAHVFKNLNRDDIIY